MFSATFHVESYLAPCFHIFLSCLALWSLHLGKRELVYMLLVQLYVYLAYASVCLFSLPLGVGVGYGL